MYAIRSYYGYDSFDPDDPALTFVDTGYYGTFKTGSANYLNRVTHNGQFNGVADIGGGNPEIGIGSNYHVAGLRANLTLITNTNPAVVTSTGHSFTTGDLRNNFV